MVAKKKCKALYRLISQLFLNQIPPDLVCDIIILTTFNLGHVTFVQGHISLYGNRPFISIIKLNAVVKLSLIGRSKYCLSF